MKIYLSAPYRSDRQINSKKMAHIEHYLKSTYPDKEFWCRHGKMKNAPEENIFSICIEKIMESDEIWICGPHYDSDWMKAEMSICKAMNLQMIMMDFLWNGLEINMLNYFVDMKSIENQIAR